MRKRRQIKKEMVRIFRLSIRRSLALRWLEGMKKINRKCERIKFLFVWCLNPNPAFNSCSVIVTSPEWKSSTLQNYIGYHAINI